MSFDSRMWLMSAEEFVTDVNISKKKSNEKWYENESRKRHCTLYAIHVQLTVEWEKNVDPQKKRFRLKTNKPLDNGVKVHIVFSFLNFSRNTMVEKQVILH